MEAPVDTCQFRRDFSSANQFSPDSRAILQLGLGAPGNGMIVQRGPSDLTIRALMGVKWSPTILGSSERAPRAPRGSSQNGPGMDFEGFLVTSRHGGFGKTPTGRHDPMVPQDSNRLQFRHAPGRPYGGLKVEWGPGHPIPPRSRSPVRF